MKLYEINSAIQQILDSVDTETGEISIEAEEALQALELTRSEKILNTSKYIKSLDAEADAIAAEIKKLQARKKQIENKAESVKGYLLTQIHTGETIKDAQVVISWRKSASVSIIGDVPQEYCKVVVEPSKTLLKEALEKGVKLDCAVIVEKNNLLIK